METEEKIKYTKKISFKKEKSYQEALVYLEKKAREIKRVFVGHLHKSPSLTIIYYLNPEKTKAVKAEPIPGKGKRLFITNNIEQKIFSELKDMGGRVNGGL